MQFNRSYLKFKIIYRFIFGYRGDFKNNILLHKDNNQIIYPAGNSIIFYHEENKA
jgi:hypothetical protein